jgi:hypothetical protein
LSVFFIRVEREKKRGRLKYRTQKKRENRADQSRKKRNRTQCGHAALH